MPFYDASQFPSSPTQLLLERVGPHTHTSIVFTIHFVCAAKVGSKLNMREMFEADPERFSKFRCAPTAPFDRPFPLLSLALPSLRAESNITVCQSARLNCAPPVPRFLPTLCY